MMLLLLLWAIASLYWSVDRGSSFLGISQFSSLIFLALLASQLTSDTLQRYLLPAALIAATLAALIGIGQHFGFNPLALRQASPPASTFINKNYAANYLDLLVPVALLVLLAQSQPRKPRTLLAATAFTAGLGFLVIAQSRGSWLGLLVGAVALVGVCVARPDLRRYVFEAAHRHRYALIISLTLVVLLSFTDSRVISERAQAKKLETITSLSADHSIETRLHTYLNTSAGILDHPWLGVGYGAFVTGFAPYVAAVKPVEIINQNYSMPHAHSDPLQMFFELGVPGGILALAIYLALIAMAWRIAISNGATSLRFTGLGLMLALLASGAHATIDFPLRLPTSAFFFWLWSGLIVGLYMQLFPPRYINVSRVVLVAVGIFGLSLTLHAANIYHGYLRANSDVLTAKLHALNNDCEAAFDPTNRAMNEFGLDHQTRFWYVKVYTYCEATSNEKLRAMDRALAYDPNLPLARLTRARIQLADNYLSGAAVDFDRYRELLPHRPEGYQGLVRIALRVDRPDKARVILQDALRWLPEDEALARQLERLQPGSQN